ncbi:hypothetical protein ACPXAO_24690, partial [Salmonella enterica]|uniref:hypothetical protein n=1 Tax=Salmonella enterica TaxID=28901 RepID=UPI003CF9FD20
SNAAVRWVVLAVLAGLPVALVLAWVFDLTPDGLVRIRDAADVAEMPPREARARRSFERRMNLVLAALLLIAAGYLV